MDLENVIYRYSDESSKFAPMDNERDLNRNFY